MTAVPFGKFIFTYVGAQSLVNGRSTGTNDCHLSQRGGRDQWFEGPEDPAEDCRDIDEELLVLFDILCEQWIEEDIRKAHQKLWVMR